MGEAHPVLVEVERSGFVESRHRGVAVALDADGRVVRALGPVAEPIFPRSTVKPFQAVAMLRNGLALDGELLALAAASHSGEEFHVEGVARILASADLGFDALGCPPDWPLDAEAERALVRAGGSRDPRYMNCSGKHAAMLVTCRVNGWPLDSYLDPAHPLQISIRATLEEFARERVAMVGVDGCGAPLFGLSPLALARAFHSLGISAPGTPEGRVAAAMRAHPAWTSGTRRDENTLMSDVPGLIVKSGAEGVEAFCLPTGASGLVKIDDGSARARTPVTIALLTLLGTTTPLLTTLATTPITGGPTPVGTLHPTPTLP
ncbi:asparaginase [Actinocorallia sp. A-T 12471]|uniref:asparaginase n=1 Tax=Actinocorallia sp. A-T 12471 TaxID=3089813 RepID=UPI0029CBB789|nr:asparaginase [Actinocorallia sp. A-T 12471]MDX6738297.1 asparaginase [Actinocorallia sp. A-T 12471]